MKSIVFPGKFLLGKGILSDLETYVKPLGKKILVISSNSVMGIAKEKITGIPAEFVLFGGECSRNEIKRLAGIAKEKGCDCVVGIGGGKLLDTAKSVAYDLGEPVVIVPTIAATDAPCSALSVIYTDDHVFEDYAWLPANPNMVLIDTAIVGKAPVRYLVSGMGDALATFFEARAVRDSNSNTCAVAVPGKQTLSAYALAELCYKTLIAEGVKAVRAMEAGVVTDAVEDIIEANVLLSGIGFESGGLAGAHAIHNGLTVLPQTHSVYHGEKVAFGLIAQLVLENAPIEELNTIIGFCKSVGLPTTFAEIGLAGVSDEDLMKAAEAASVPGETIHCEPLVVTADKVFAALKAADSFGKAYKG